MDYEKKYKKARSRAKELISRCKNNRDYKTMIYRAEDIVSIFPELRESEGERIKKVLIDYFNRHNVAINLFYGIKIDEVISWLEKQGEQKIDIPKWKYKKDDMPLLKDSIILNKYGCVVKSPSGAMVSDAWVLDYDELTKLPKEEVEKQEEKAGNSDKVEPKDYSSIDPFFFKTTDVEKETDFKLELDFDFSVGQWIVACGKKVFLITKIDGFNITLVDTNGDEYVFDVSSLKDARLWTIENAKDGDVLTWNDSKCITIFKNIYDKESFESHGFVGHHTGIFRTGKHYHAIKGAHPATKEQRDKLIKAMSDAGYTFDFENKELKLLITNGGDFEQENCEQKNCLEREDEVKINRIVSVLENLNVADNDILLKDAEWLESLKCRVHLSKWKPSDEQMKALEHFVRSIGESGHASPYDANLKLVHSLLNDLKKLNKE